MILNDVTREILMESYGKLSLRLGLGTGQFFRYDIRIDTNRSIFDISFDICVKDCYI